MKNIVLILSLLPFCFTLSISADERWRSYSVYEPSIERFTVYDPEKGELKYNHCSTIAYFQNTWFLLWNANTVPRESISNQLIYQSTSADGKTWGPPELSFSSPQLSYNPVPTERQRDYIQWQPGLIVVQNELWCFWSILAFEPGSPKLSENYGCYFSVLRERSGKWQHRRLTWEGKPDIAFEQTNYRIFPVGNPTQLSTGRVLVPIMLIGPKQAPDSLFDRERYCSVLFTDDLGKNWKISRGTKIVGREWAAWEPTVFEKPDGTLGMIARNGLGPEPKENPLSWQDTLVGATSTDCGENWTTLVVIPLESVISRPMVSRLEAHTTTLPQPAERYLMVHNDARSFIPQPLRDRSPLSLFFNRGGGFDFQAGLSITGDEVMVAYPQFWAEGGRLMVSYTRSMGDMAIQVAQIDPLPKQDQYYIFPRSRVVSDSSRPSFKGKVARFFQHQFATSRTISALGSKGFSGVAWVRTEIQGNLLDTFDAEKSLGFNWSLYNGRATFETPKGVRLRPVHEYERYQHWSQVGFTLDLTRKEVRFFANGKMVDVKKHESLGSESTTGLRAMVCGTKSGNPGIVGDLRYLALYPFPLSESEQIFAYNAFAGEMGRTNLSGASPIVDLPVLTFDPARPDELERDFELPANIKAGQIDTVQADGLKVLRFYGEIAAGLDLDPNDRSQGDRVMLRFAFRMLKGPGAVICTVGDTHTQVRLICNEGRLSWRGEGFELDCGAARPDWNRVQVETGEGFSSVSINGGPTKRSTHTPKATWIYLGQGFREGTYPRDAAFEIDIASVGSTVMKR